MAPFILCRKDWCPIKCEFCIKQCISCV